MDLLGNEKLWLLLILFIFIYYLIISKNGKSPPGPWGLPIFGASFFIQKAQYLTFQKWSKKYGPILKTQIGTNTVIILDDSDVMRRALNDPAFSGRGDNKVLSIIAGGKFGITSNEGPDWLEQRRFVLKHLRDFGFGKQSMEHIIKDEVMEFMKWLGENHETPIEVNKRFTLATLNTIWRIAAGDRNAQDDEKLVTLIYKTDECLQELARSTLLVLFPKLIDILPKFMLGPWYNAKAIMDEMQIFFLEAIKDHEDHPIGKDETPRDLIDVYLKAIDEMEDSESSFYKDKGRKSLVAVVGDLFAAGAGATSETISWSILYLASFPHVQKKLQDEIDGVIGKSRLPKLSDRTEMPYAECIINEVLRYGSIAPIIFHYTSKSTLLDGFSIKKNTTVISNVYSIHHKQELWGDPDVFRPERFLSADGATLVKSDHLIPFGIGRRQCIGETLARLNVFLFLTTICQRYFIMPDPLNPNPSLNPIPGFILQAQPFKVVFSERV